MLESIRNASQGVVGKAIMTIVMGLIIVSFVIWGVGDMLRGFSPSTVASVGGAKISAQDYNVAYDRAIQQYQRRFKRPFTNEEARQIGLDRSVLQQLLSEAAVDDEARKLGLGISDEALREVITSNPNFHDKSGAFDPNRFAGALRDMDMNERGFVSELRKQVVRQFIVGALATGITAPKAEVTAEADYQGQTRSADYFLLPASAAGDDSCAVRRCAQNLLQRSQVELSRARIPGDDHSGARAGHDRQRRRRDRRRRRGGLSEDCRKGSPVRRAREARSAADPVSQ